MSPADRYAELFVDVQSSRLFPDSKTFVDAAPRGDPEAILAAYRAGRGRPGFDLRRFIDRHFTLRKVARSGYVSVPGQSLAEHIDGLWPVLTRHPSRHPPHASLLGLPHDYLVPGGRFDELYYWDSYFTMVGLPPSGRTALLESMTENFAYLIDTYGHVPNGTRTYYLSRSQPPVFALMVALCEASGGTPAVHYLPQLKLEHAFWMDGASHVRPGEAHRRVVRLPDGTLLNRYWDDRDTPREEAWIEDVTTARASDRPAEEVYRHLRAAAESGWDFSSRWLVEAPEGEPPNQRLADIRTTAIVPVDLNALLWKLETSIAALSRQAGDTDTADAFDHAAAARRQAIVSRMWRPAEAHFCDLDLPDGAPRRALTAACVVPLYVGLAEPAQADAQAATLEARLLAPGGLATTEVASGEQWDRPNGWAPLQWMAINGLAHYGHRDLAQRVRDCWLRSVGEVYEHEAKLVEKYTLRAEPGARACAGDGGEYPSQDGFGWTNGVTRRLLSP